jgi:hypothetical protein
MVAVKSAACKLDRTQHSHGTHFVQRVRGVQRGGEAVSEAGHGWCSHDFRRSFERLIEPRSLPSEMDLGLVEKTS